MRFKNFEVEHLHNLLFGLSLKGKESRMRTRFVNSLRKQLEDVIIPEQEELVQNYAKLDENKNLIPTSDGKGFKLTEETAKEYHAEHAILMNEFFYIEENVSNRAMLLSVAELMLEGDFEVSGEVADMYDRWCEQFERVIENYEQEENENIECEVSI